MNEAIYCTMFVPQAMEYRSKALLRILDLRQMMQLQYPERMY